MDMQIDREIDARGSPCPGPLMELIRAVRESSPGTTIAVLSSDRGSKTDIPAWTSKAGHRLLAVEDEVDHARFVVRMER